MTEAYQSAEPAIEASTPLARTLAIGDAELAALGTLFEASVQTRIDGATAAFSRIAGGQSIARALRVPEAAIEFLYGRAHKWFAAGRFDRAEAIFRTLCIIAPDTAEFRVGLGVCLRRREAWLESLDAFEIAARMRPAWAVPRFHKLELLTRRQAWDQAVAELQAFEARSGAEVPPGFVHAAARYRYALELHRPANPPAKDLP
jgi:tetratricopeptide (TPR) repeat protein